MRPAVYTSERMEMARVMERLNESLSIEEDGSLTSAGGRYDPVLQDQPSLEMLSAAMRMVGVEPGPYMYQVYHVTASNPFEGGAVTLAFPQQVVLVGPGYAGQHQLNLVLKHPMVTAIEILSALRRGGPVGVS